MGITSAIYENEDVSLAGYLRRVARSMTDFVHMRDEPYDAQLTRRDLSRSYHAESIEKAKARLTELDGISLADAERMAKAEYDDEYRDWRERKHKNEELRRRYESMVEKVEAWDCPEQIAYMKEHALKYLRESIDFDCHDYEGPHFGPPKRKLGPDWLRDQRERATHDIDYHTAEVAKQEGRDTEFNVQIDLFLAELEKLESATTPNTQESNHAK
jgi:hypothetical protein